MFFTKDDLQTIEQYLKARGKRDTEFDPISPEELDAEDTLSVVHNAENRQISINDFFSSSISADFLQLEMLNIRELERLLQEKLDRILAIIDILEFDKLGVTSQFGNSDILAISQDFFTDTLHGLVDNTAVSTANLEITTTYRRLRVPSGNNNEFVTYIIPTVTLTERLFPKVWFIGSNGTKTELELSAIIDGSYLNSGNTYQKEVTTTDYYVITETGHTITAVTNSAGFSYLSAFLHSTITKNSTQYNVYHYNRAISPIITLNFTIN